MLGAHNWKYALDPKGLIYDGFGVDAVRLGINKNPRHVALLKEMREAGIIDAVDANTLIRDRELHLAEKSILGRVAAAANRPVEFSQMIGFDAAEQDVLITAYLSARDKFLRANPKADMTSERIRDKIQAEARAFTLNMNRAGEMPYSQNTLGVAAQFLSFRHKAMMQPVTNRNLNKTERLGLLAYTTAVFGLDASWMKLLTDQVFRETPESLTAEEMDMLYNGLWSSFMNGALTMASGEDQNIDWSDMAPVEAFGSFNVLWSAINDVTLSKLITESPAGSLIFGANPRVTDAFKTGLRAFTPMDYDDPLLKTEPADVIKSTISLMSGASNYFKGRYALEMGKKMSSSGRITDQQVTEIEALAQGMFGLQTQDEKGVRRAYEELNKVLDRGYPDMKDVDIYYNELKRQVTRKGATVAEMDMAMAVLGEVFRVFGDDYSGVIKHIEGRIKRDAAAGDHSIVEGITRQMGFIKEQDFMKIVRKLPPAQRTLLIEAYKYQYGES
jgi:hypothetical protein